MLSIALIPSYEPDENLLKLLKELKDNNFTCIVVNDGSDTKYNTIFKKAEKYAYVISYGINMGKGYALKKGLSYIKENYDKYIIVTLDSDGQHKVSDAINLVKEAKNNLDTLILGKRIRSNKTPIRSRIGNAITKIVFKLNTNLDIYDTQTGLRAYSYKLIDYMLSINGNRYEYEMNQLLSLKDNNIKYKEIEIETIYINNNKGSHFNTIKDSYKIYKEIIKYSLSSFVSFLFDYLLYIIFILLFNNAIVSNILSRILSSTLNYNINKTYVFKSKNKSLISYFALASIILILNTLFLSLLTYININVYIAKIIVELVLFSLSYIIQKKIIFKKEAIFYKNIL